MNGEHAGTGPREKTVPRNRDAHLPSARPTDQTVPRNRSGRIPAGWARVLIGSAVVIFTITACTGDPAPVGTVPDGSPTNSSAGTTTIPEPVRPIDKATPESAIQFTRYFWDLYNYAYQTYDTAPLKTISDPGCKYCSSTIDDVKRVSDAKTKIEGHTVAVVEAASPPQKITSGTAVVAKSDQRPGRAVSQSGEAITLKGSRGIRFTFALAWRSGQWKIERVDYDPKSGKPWVE